MRVIILTLGLLLPRAILFTAFGQNGFSGYKPEGHFLTDSTMIGQSTPYALVFRRPSNVQCVFPDSNYKFGNFHLLNRNYFPSVTVNNLTTDCTIYYLAYYDLFDSLELSVELSAFTADGDSANVATNPDVVFFKTSLNPNTPIQSAMQQKPFPLVPNPLFLPLTLLAILVLLLLLYILFRNQITRFVVLKRLEYSYQRFSREFRMLQDSLIEKNEKTKAEQLVSHFKKYIGQTSGTPFESYSTSEIKRTLGDQELVNCLSTIDRYVYGDIEPGTNVLNLAPLKRVAEDVYLSKYKEIAEKK